MNQKRNIIIAVVSILVVVFIGFGVVAFMNYASLSRNRNVIPEEVNNSSFEESFDWSEYTTHGEFGPDGIAWVCIDNYTGSNCGYINKNKEYVFDLMDKNRFDPVKTVGFEYLLDDYQDGTAVIVYTNDETDMDHGCFIGVYDTNGKVIDEVEQSRVRCNYEVKHLDNGNIVIYGGDFTPDYYYMYGAKSKKIKELEISFIDNVDELEYSDGLLYIYDRDVIGTPGPRYFDESGNLVLKITTESNENFTRVNSGTPFENGKATINFKGKDNNNYTVTIDKKGKWLDEPVRAED